MRPRALTIMVLLLGLQGCGGLWPEPPPPARSFDFGPLPAVTGPAPRDRLELGRVDAPIWLEVQDILYRRQYAQPGALSAYAGSEWAAPPADLFAHRLRFRLAQHEASAPSAQPARLSFELQAFEQVFESPENAYVHAAALATVLPRGGPSRQRLLQVQLPADATVHGATRRLPEAADALIEQLFEWLAE
jgi:hypothetical protein